MASKSRRRSHLSADSKSSSPPVSAVSPRRHRTNKNNDINKHKASKKNKARVFPRFQLPNTETEQFQFSISSYNMLAGAWDTQEMYSYVPPKAADPTFRLNLLRHELLSLHADVMCVQEIDLTRVETDFVQFLKDEGYDCVVQSSAKRGKGFTMGLATFFRRSKFQLAWAEHRSRTLTVALVCTDGSNESKTVSIPVSIPEEKVTADETAVVAPCPDVSATVTVLPDTTVTPPTPTVAVEEPAPSTTEETVKPKLKRKRSTPKPPLPTFPAEDMLYVVNVHLDAAPEKGPVRLKQLQSAFKRLNARIAETTVPTATAANSSVVVCGDFNSSLDETVYTLMMEGQLPAGATENKVVVTTQDYVSPVGCCRSAYSKHGGEPPFTYCARGSKGTVDFLFGSSFVTPVGVMSVYADQEDEETVATKYLPSVTHGSDHLPVAAVYERTVSKMLKRQQ